MTEQPAEPDHRVGEDHSTPEHRIARALRANDLANALITMRDDDMSCARLIEDAINEDGHIYYDTAVEIIRMLANAILTINHRVSLYAKDLNHAHGDPDYFANLHSKAVLGQALNPTIRRIDHHNNTTQEDNQ